MSRIAVVGYPSDVTDEEWEFVLPYLLLCREDSPQRKHDLRRVFKRGAVRGANRWAVALPSARVRPVVGGLPADAAMAGCGRVRGADRRCAGDCLDSAC